MNVAQGVASLFGVILLSTSAVYGQQAGPMSAIDWLSESVSAPRAPLLPQEEPTSGSASSPSITVTTLDAPSPDRIGLLSSDVTGLPMSLWSGSSTATLTNAISNLPPFDIPALRDFTTVLMLAEADAPLDSTPEGHLFLARTDALLAMGRLDEATALLEAAKPETSVLFRRYFDIALLKGEEDRACTVMQERPDVAPTPIARIFCLARSGDWNAAALTLNTNRVLGDMTDTEVELLTFFLDPELADGEDIPLPQKITPLTFRLREAIGGNLRTATLPIAFAHADLRSTTGWKAQLDAAERLARAGSLPASTLQALYGSRTPSASGGVWDRLDAFQEFEMALSRDDAEGVTLTLPGVWSAMQSIKSETLFAQLYGEELKSIPLTGVAEDIAGRLGLLTPDYEAVAATRKVAPFLVATARGTPQDVEATGPVKNAIQSAFADAKPPAELADLAENGQLGAALLKALALLDRGVHGDQRALSEGLAFLRHVGLEDMARRTSLQILILERQR